MYYDTFVGEDTFREFKEVVVNAGLPEFKQLLNSYREDAYDDGFESGREYAYEDPELGSDWVIQGMLDYEVEQRAKEIGMVYPTANPAHDNLLQEMHAAQCLTGPYGWEYCAKCNK